MKARQGHPAGKSDGKNPRRRPSEPAPKPSAGGAPRGSASSQGAPPPSRNRGWETVRGKKSEAGNARAPPGLDSSSKDKNEFFRIMRNRFLFASQSLVGNHVEISTVDGVKYEGIFYTCGVDDFAVVIKEASVKSGTPSFEFTPGSTLTIEQKDLVQLHARSVSLAERTEEEGFKTDADISRAYRPDLDGRELEVAHHLVGASPSASVGQLEEQSHKGKSWDQFKVNESLFGVKSTYDENLYTTRLNKEDMPEEIRKKAEQIAREIEGQSSSNIHLAEERGQMSQNDDMDEESRYSSVVRAQAEPAARDGHGTLGRNKRAYVPPALRGKAAQASPQGEVAPSGATAPVNRSAPEEKPTARSATPQSERKPESPKKGPTSPPKKPLSPIKQAISPQNDTRKAAEPTKQDLIEEKAKMPPASPAQRKGDQPGTPSKAKDTPKSKLNPNAKEFVLNPAARSFQPKFQPQFMPPQPGMQALPLGMHMQPYSMPHMVGGMYRRPEDWPLGMEDGSMPGAGFAVPYVMPPHMLGPRPVGFPPMGGAGVAPVVRAFPQYHAAGPSHPPNMPVRMGGPGGVPMVPGQYPPQYAQHGAYLAGGHRVGPGPDGMEHLQGQLGTEGEGISQEEEALPHEAGQAGAALAPEEGEVAETISAVSPTEAEHKKEDSSTFEGGPVEVQEGPYAGRAGGGAGGRGKGRKEYSGRGRGRSRHAGGKPNT